MAQPHTKRKKTPGIPRLSSSGALLHWIGMLAMVVGLFAPLATVDAAVTVMSPEQALMKAAQEPFTSDTADFERVVLTGDFQQQVGCGDWDTNCNQTRLQNINGFWTGVFGVPPGTWNWELVAVSWSGSEYSIANGQVNVSEGQAGIYAEFNSASRDNNVWATTGIAYANGSFGDVALAQDGDGYLASALNINSPGWVNMQVNVNGETTQTGADFQQGVSRVTFDAVGNITNVEHRGFAEVTVQRIDADGNPLSGSCFVLDGSSQTRGCDADGSSSGQGDGSTTLRFPAGFQPGSYTLRETRAAEGAEQLADQQIDVQQGQSTIEARSEGEPTPETGDLVVLRQDEVGNPVGGACFEIMNSNGEVVDSACDEDGDVADDGRIGILEVPAGDYTLSETRTPEGYEPASDMAVSVFPNEVTNQPVQSVSVAPDDPIETEEPTEEVTEEATEEATDEPTEEVTEEPIETEEVTEEATEEPTEVVAVGRIVVYREDNAGNRVGGSCFEVIDSNGQIVGDACDEDGIAADDGSTGVENVPVGDYTMVESRVPAGYEQAPDTPVTVTEGDVIYTVTSAASGGPEEPTEEATEPATEEATEEPTEEATEAPAGAALEVTYDHDEAQPNACIELESRASIGGMEIPYACDNGANDEDPALGTIRMESLSQGEYDLVVYEGPAGLVQSEVQPVTLQEGQVVPVSLESDEPETTSFTVQTTDANGDPIGGASYILDESGDPVDADENGTATFSNVTPGEHTVRMTSAPEGYNLADPDTQTVTVAADGTSSATFQVSRSTTSFTVQTTDAEGNPVGGASYILDESGDPVGADENGTATFNDVTPGDHTVRMTNAPEGYNLADPDTQTVTVAADGSTSATFQVSRSTTSFTVQTTDAEGNPVGGASYILDESGDPVGADENGTATFNDVTPGDHTVRMTSAPDGFNIADPDTQSVTVAADGSTSATFQVSRSTTSFTVQTTDAEGNPVDGASYILDESGDPVGADENGTATFNDVTPGDHTVRMTSAPEGYNLADPDTQTVSVAADGTSSATFQVSRTTTSFTVQTTDAEGNPVGGASYILDESGDPVPTDENGTVTFNDVAPGDHTVRMTSAPEGYNVADPDTQTVTVAADGSTSSATFQVSAVTVDIVINTVNENTSEPIGGACYTLNDGEIACDEADSGQVIFQGQVPGDHSLSMETAPEGFEPAPDQVIPAGTTNIQIGLQQETGTIQVAVVDDATGEALPGACVQISTGEPTCDDADGTSDGVITFSGVTTGEQQITITGVPEGYETPGDEAASQTVTVSANETTNAEFRLTETPPAIGNLDVTVLLAGDDVAVENVCLIATMEGTDNTATACDEDGDGVVNFTDLQAGTYLITLDEEQYDGPPIETVTPVSGTVPAGETGTATLYLIPEPTTGTLEITVTADGSNVPGACVTIGDQTVCDDQDGDTNATPGVINITDIEPTESLAVSMSTLPDGFQQPADQTVAIQAGQTTSIEFALEAEVEPGSVTVRTVDGNGDPLNNACYRLVQGSTIIGPICDSEPADGEVIFEDVAPGDYRLEQTTRPSNQWDTPSARNITVNGGENTLVEIEMTQRTGQLRITTVDRDDTSVVLQGACYVLVGDTEFGPFCDADDGTSDGIVRFANVPAGQYELRQTVSTAGYDPAENRNVTINPGGSTQITVLNERVQPPSESGTLIVIPLDPSGNAVQGGCYQVFDGDTPVTNRVCDNADDQPASITFENLPVGDLTLRETLAPSPDWLLAGDISVTIANGETTTVEVPHELKPGNVVVQAVNSVGLPLQGACFTFSGGGDTELCTDNTGQATISGITPGTHQLTQTEAPFGYKLNETPRDVNVHPGQTTTVRVVFENEPPPNTGTVQVQKFYCPAGEEGERTVFMGGAQGNQELQQTAGCEPGIATFTMTAEDGSTESNANFSTNAEGRAQLTAVEGIYVLTETDPDMPGNSSARLRVGVGQMTTVIVINYVAPPAPAPVTINVEGYTCPPGFNGTSFVDFQNSCMAETQLTNQITVRAEAEARYKRSTGDTGVLGKTSFVDLPNGTYTIWAERPHSVPVSYMFCGADVNNPGLKTVNGSLSVTLESGSTILCRVFQVPSLFDADHGAIQVQKYNCPINERQRGYDYQNECDRATEPIPFEIQQVDPKTGDLVGDPVRVNTNGDGIVQFPMLVPGTYKLTEVDGEWCVAQSNSVDANGDVVVQKDSLSEVWVYNCVGTKSPPNTGSGDAAGPFGPDSGISPAQVLPNLIWPAVLLAGWMILRDRKQA